MPKAQTSKRKTGISVCTNGGGVFLERKSTACIMFPLIGPWTFKEAQNNWPKMFLKSQLNQQSPDSCAEQRWSAQPTEYALRNSAAMNPSVLWDHLDSAWWSAPPGARGWGRTSHLHYIKGDTYEFFGHTWGIIFIQLVGSLAIRHLNTWCPKVRGEAGATASTFWLLGGQSQLEWVWNADSGVLPPAFWIHI